MAKLANKSRNNLTENVDNPDIEDENYERIDLKDEQSTYTALKRSEEDDDQLYTHL
jgi:phage terminase Nu1 subunit (DNA packaging protein)